MRTTVPHTARDGAYGIMYWSRLTIGTRSSGAASGDRRRTSCGSPDPTAACEGPRVPHDPSGQRYRDGDGGI